MDSKKTVPFQRNQMQKIVDIMGLPTKENWPLLPSMPEYSQLATMQPPLAASAHYHGHHGHHHGHHHHRSHRPSYPHPGSAGGNGAAAQGPHVHGSSLEKWYWSTVSQGAATTAAQAANSAAPLVSLGAEGYKLLASLLEYDPAERMTAAKALQHPFFTTGDRLNASAFEGLKNEYPHRRVSQDDNDIRTNSLPGTKRNALQDDSLRPAKRLKE